jgi:hypothetical protein
MVAPLFFAGHLAYDVRPKNFKKIFDRLAARKKSMWNCQKFVSRPKKTDLPPAGTAPFFRRRHRGKSNVSYFVLTICVDRQLGVDAPQNRSKISPQHCMLWPQGHSPQYMGVVDAASTNHPLGLSLAGSPAKSL